MDPRIEALVAKIRGGHSVERDELRSLLDRGCDPGALLDAFAAAADGTESRRFHRALGLLRDLRR